MTTQKKHNPLNPRHAVDGKPDICADMDAKLAGTDNAEQAFSRWVHALDIPAAEKSSLVEQFKQGGGARHAAVRRYAALNFKKHMTKVPSTASHK